MALVEDAAEDKRAVRPYGRWESPLTPVSVAAAAGSASWPSVVGAETWWCASQATTATIRLLRCASPGAPVHDVLGGVWKVSNGAIGYGGRPYLAVPADAAEPADAARRGRHLLVFTHSLDGRLYAADVDPLAEPDDGRAATASAPIPLTPVNSGDIETCYADPVLGPDGLEVWCIRETIRGGVSTDVTRDVVAVPLSGAAAEDPAAVRRVARSHDFLSGIRVSPDGTRLAWIGWDHPDMPWDVSSLMVARIADGRAADPVRVLGGDGVSVPQAEWADAHSLYAMADPDGWWNLHRVTLGDGRASAECVLPMESECSHPIWRVGSTSFAVTASGVVFRHGVGAQQMTLWDPATGELTDLAGEWTEFAIGLSGDASAVAVVAGSPAERAKPVRIEVARAEARRCAPRRDDDFEPWHARGERRSVPGPDGRPVHFVYHPPTSPDHRGPAETAPPLVVDVHGGPTSTTGDSRTHSFSLLCSRGFAVASVDYGGSTGYGRAYRDLLRRSWGLVDVEDCVTVARALAAAGLADPARTGIRGGSAGGWTTLAALAHTDVFCCGAVSYPISDPLTWSGSQTHDFESRYIESLVGRLPADEPHFRRVSPLANAHRIRAPFVMLQGLDDEICHPDQARRIVEAVDAAHGPGLCRAHLEFPGEGHGFRRAGTIAAALDAELALFTDVMVLP